MEPQDPTTANAALWARFIADQWKPAITLFGGPNVAETIAADIARALTSAFGDPISRMYAENAVHVNHFVREREEAEQHDTPPPPWLTDAPTPTAIPAAFVEAMPALMV